MNTREEILQELYRAQKVLVEEMPEEYSPEWQALMAIDSLINDYEKPYTDKGIL